MLWTATAGPGSGSIKTGTRWERPAYHPRALLGVWLYGFMTGVRSSRKLEAACRDQIPYMWLTGCSDPTTSRVAFLPRPPGWHEEAAQAYGADSGHDGPGGVGGAGGGTGRRSGRTWQRAGPTTPTGFELVKHPLQTHPASARDAQPSRVCGSIKESRCYSGGEGIYHSP